MIEAPPRPLRLALGGLVALAAAMGIGRFIYTPILPFMVESLGLSQGRAGLIASANYVGYLAGALFGVLPFASGSQRRWVLGALAANAATTAAMALTTSVAAFIVLRFIGGFASALTFVFAASLVLDRLAAQGRSDLSAMHFAGVGTGIAVSAILVSGLAATGAEWGSLWLGGALATAVAVLAVAWLLPGDPVHRSAIGAPSGVGRRADLARLVVAYGLYGFGYVITATFLVALVRLTPDMRSIEPTVWLLVGLSAAPSILPWNALARRIGVFCAFAVACIVEAVGVAASVLWMSTWGAAFAAVMLGGTFVAITALGVAGARILAAGHQRRTIALLTASFGLGQIVGPSLAGFIHDLSGSFLAPSLAAAAALVLAAALTVTIHDDRTKA